MASRYKKGTKLERKKIIDCYEKVKEELYTLVGVIDYKNAPTTKDIKEGCEYQIQMIKEQGLDKSPEFIESAIKEYDEIYEILSNERLREVYDREFFNQILDYSNGEKMKSWSKNVTLNAMFLTLALPFEDIATLVGGTNGVVASPLTYAIDFIKNGGTFKLLKNYVCSFLAMSPMIMTSGAGSIISGIVLNKYVNSSTIKNYAQLIAELAVGRIVTYPGSLFLNTFIISPLSMSVLQVVKNVILRKDITGSFQWKNLFYGFGSILTIQVTKDLIDSLINEYCERQFEKDLANKSNRSPNKLNNYYYYYSLKKVILKTLLAYPLSVIEYQYFNQFVQSYLNNSTTSIPIVLNPISMAIKISKQQTLKKFYNGVLFSAIANFFEKFSNNFLYNNSKPCFFEY